MMFVERKANNHSLSARFVKPVPKNMADSFLMYHDKPTISKIETLHKNSRKITTKYKENNSNKKKPKNYRVVINL